MNDTCVIAVSEGKEKTEWPNISRAAKTLRISYKCVANALSSGNFYSGFWWFWKDRFDDSFLEYLGPGGKYLPGFNRNYYRFIINKYQKENGPLL